MSSYDLYAPRWALPPDVEFKGLDEAPFARGINSIQLFADESGWRVSGLAWDEETPESAIPPEYLVVRA